MRTIICSIILAGIAVLTANAQLNFQPDSIIFRATAQQNKRTWHHGSMDILGKQGTTALNVKNTRTDAVDYYGILSRAELATGYGWAGYFLGGATGVRGEAGKNVNRSAFGGWFKVTTASSHPGALRCGVYGTVSGSGTQKYAGYFNGNVYCSGSYLPSDQQVKINITTIGNPVSKVMELKPVEFEYDKTKHPEMNFSDGRKIGLIAQDVEAVFPTMVKDVAVPDDVEGAALKTIKSVDYIQLIPVLIAAIQEQQKEIETLKAAMGK